MTGRPHPGPATGRSRRVTLDDLAAASGLSKQTVSHVLGTRAHLFRPETVELVRSTAARLGWRRNRAAQAVSNGRQGQIALLLSTTGRRSVVTGGFLAGLHDAAAARDQFLLLARIDDARLRDPVFVPEILAHLACDGLVVKYDCATPPRLGELIDAQVLPAIWVNQRRACDAVRPDDAGAVALGLQILAGRARIGFADLALRMDPAEEHYSRGERSAAFAALRPGAPQLTVAGQDPVAPAARWLAEARPDAVLACNDITAQAMVRAAALTGLRIPQDLALLTFGDGTAHADGRRLAVLDHPDQEMGRVAVEMLAERIADPTCHLPERTLPFTLLPGHGL